MKKKHYIIICIVAAALIAAVAAAIIIPKTAQKPAEEPAVPETPQEQAEAGEAVTVGDISGYMDGDTVLLTMDGTEIDWDEYSGWLNYGLRSYEMSYGEVTDWTAESTYDPDTPTYEAVKEFTLGTMRFYKALEAYAGENGIGDEAEYESRFKQELEGISAQFGGEEGLEAYIKQTFGSMEMFEYFAKIGYIYNDAFSGKYGENGEKLTDDDVFEYLEDGYFFCAKHILFKTTDDAGNPLSEDEIAGKRAEAESVLAELRAYTGKDIEGNFTKYAEKYTDDGQAEAYLFQQGDMVTEFEDAVRALGDYEISDLVESQFGYHIILRLPIDPDLVPVRQAMYGKTSSLRKLVADELFYSQIEEFGEKQTVEESEEYKNLNLADVFASAK